MSGKRNKKLRKEVYGDIKQNTPSYTQEIVEKEEVFKVGLKKVKVMIKKKQLVTTGLRNRYKQMKKMNKNK